MVNYDHKPNPNQTQLKPAISIKKSGASCKGDAPLMASDLLSLTRLSVSGVCYFLTTLKLLTTLPPSVTFTR